MVIYRSRCAVPLLSLALLLGVQASATAQAAAPGPNDGELLGLADAMSRARVEAAEPLAARAREKAARARSREAAGWRLPEVRLSETWIRTDAPAEAFALELNQERFSFQNFVASDPNSPDPLETAISRVEIEIPVWTGGELSTRVEQARLGLSAAAAGASRAGDLAATNAAEAWIQLAQAREYAALLERSREAVAAHVDQARAYSAQGMLVRSELLRAEVELARMDDLLAEARGGARVAAANLAFRLGAPTSAGFRLTPVPEPPDVGTEVETWLATAADRPDLESARQLLAAGELEAKARRGALLPRIGVVARHDWTDDKLFGGHGDSTSIYAGATWSLFDGGRRRAAVTAAEAEAAAGRVEVEQFGHAVRLEVRQHFEAARVALERRATALAALASAREALRITEERFAAGVVKTLDVLDAATSLREAETRELVARTDAHLAALRLATAAGRRPESVLTSPEEPSR